MCLVIGYLYNIFSILYKDMLHTYTVSYLVLFIIVYIFSFILFELFFYLVVLKNL